MEEYPGKIKLALKNYPYRYRDYSHLAAEALLAAGDQGKYWEMHDIMIKNSPDLDRKSLIRYAEESVEPGVLRDLTLEVPSPGGSS